MPEVGEILGGKYRLGRPLGKGGMGSVFEAVHEELGKSVAIKVPNAELGGDPQALERFRREPRLAAATGHPGIVDIYDVGTTPDGLPYVVMEYLRGESLSSLLARQGRLDVRLATSVVAQVLSALDAAHGKKIVHRDLKPDNVFLVDTGQTVPEVKLLDFGTSKAVGGELRGATLTESGTILGTPFYIAPEQIRDEPDLDLRTDIYSVGVMLYETLTGQPPFRAENVYTLVHKVLNEDVVPPCELRRDVPPALEEVVLRALARKPADRFASAASMLRALLPFLDERALGRLVLPEALREGDLPMAREPRREGPEPTDRDGVSGEAETVMADLEPPRSRGSVRAFAIAGAIAVVVAAALLLGRGHAGGERGGPREHDAAASAPVASAADAVAARGGGSDAAPGDGAPGGGLRLVTLTVTGAPEGAVVAFDGAELSAPTIRLRPSAEARELEVRLGDRVLLRRMVTLEEDTTVEVAAADAPPTKAAGAPARPGRGPRAPAAAAEATTEGGGEPPPPHEPAPTKRPSDLDFAADWHPGR